MRNTMTRNFTGRLFMVIPFALILLGIAEMAVASGGAEFLPIMSSAMLWRVVNFIVLFGALYYFMAKPFRDFFVTRREEILASLEKAKSSKEEAEARYQELSQRLADRDKEFEEIRRTAVESAEKTKERMIAEAREKAIWMEKKAKESIEQEMKKARDALKREAAELAVTLSEEKLIKDLTPSDHDRFMEEYIAGMK